MEHIAALLLVIGCSGDLKDCREIPPPDTVFETMEQCASRLVPARKQAQRSAQRVYLQCLPVDASKDEEDARLQWQVRNGKLQAEVVFDGGPMAMTRGSTRLR